MTHELPDFEAAFYFPECQLLSGPSNLTITLKVYIHNYKLLTVYFIVLVIDIYLEFICTTPFMKGVEYR